ncbi:hypothetical protein VTN77DRAFT_938 [Rasamsonia byssochlamydoides]|uniref:uncharacterized protein n=1 Tax=Rasamsonia byssochlamydoides TaxID=89139 RepID=UPI0037437663
MAAQIPAEEYTVGWICALPVECTAAYALLDRSYERPPVAQNDDNSYMCGQMGKHNVVIVCLPKSRFGEIPAATAATSLIHSFPNIEFGLMVGIGGGAPSDKHDIRLGDVVVSERVIYYQRGKMIQNGEFQRTGSLDLPPTRLLTAITSLQTLHTVHGHKIQGIMEKIIDNPNLRDEYQRPSDEDILFKPNFVHPDPGRDCAEYCRLQTDQMVWRSRRFPNNPMIHYGLIASADIVMKDATVRDEIAEKDGALCFETEAAGLMNNNRFRTLVIRGISDYSDSHKNDKWQGYAAATAAAYAKELLEVIEPAGVRHGSETDLSIYEQTNLPSRGARRPVSPARVSPSRPPPYPQTYHESRSRDGFLAVNNFPPDYQSVDYDRSSTERGRSTDHLVPSVVDANERDHSMFSQNEYPTFSEEKSVSDDAFRCRCGKHQCQADLCKWLRDAERFKLANQYGNARREYQKILDYINSAVDQSSMRHMLVSTYRSMAMTYELQEDYEAAYEWHWTVAKHSKENPNENDSSIRIIYLSAWRSLAQYYERKRKYGDAQKSHQEVVNMSWLR